MAANRRAEVDKALADVDFTKNKYQVEFDTTMGKILLDVYPDLAPGQGEAAIQVPKPEASRVEIPKPETSKAETSKAETSRAEAPRAAAMPVFRKDMYDLT